MAPGSRRRWPELEGRRFQVHRPAGGPGPPHPLVMAFHGGEADGTAMRRLTNLDARADEAGFVVVYPDGVDGHWNDGRTGAAIAAGRDRIDDVAFAAALVDHLVESSEVDRRRVFATGMSNGAMLCHRLAVERPDVVAAIAPVAGPMPTPLPPPGPDGPVAVIAVHGTADPVVPYSGGRVSAGGDDRGEVLSVDATLRRWRRADACGPTPAVDDLARLDPRDPTRVRVTTWPAGPPGAEVALVEVVGGGHTWPGGPQYLPVRRIGPTTRHVRATDLITEFFLRAFR